MEPSAATRTTEPELSLAAWHADPLDRAQAHAALRRAQAGEQRALLRGDERLTWRLRQMIARFWLGRPVATEHHILVQLAADPVDHALAELVYGQLLISRKLQGADEHLAEGFHRAAPLLGARDYFIVLQRHGQLARLPLGTSPAPAQDLEALLREAAVIARLQGRRQRGQASRADTLG